MPFHRMRIARSRLRNFRKYTLTGILLSMLAPAGFAQPPCRTAFDEPEFAFAAGCMVKSGARMLAVRHHYNGKLGFPAGFAKTGESAQCVAHRETWEETGMDVVVHGMLKRFRNGFALYRCVPSDGDAVQAERPEVPASGRNEVSEVLWIEPGATAASDWRFPRDYPVILEIFKQ